MIVTRIEPISKTKYQISIDDRIAFVLNKGDLSAYALHEQTEIPEEVYERILWETLYVRARTKLANTIASMDRTVSQMRSALERDRYPEKVIDAVIELGINERLLDDGRYAGNYASSYAGRKSVMAIRMDLKNRGVSKDLIEKALEDIDPDSEREAIRKLLRKKHPSGTPLSYEEKQKLMTSILRKGYSYDCVKDCLEEYLSP